MHMGCLAKSITKVDGGSMSGAPCQPKSAANGFICEQFSALSNQELSDICSWLLPEYSASPLPDLHELLIKPTQTDHDE